MGIQSALIGERRPLVSDNHVGQILDLASVCYPRVVSAEPLNSQRARLHRCSHLVEVSADRTFLSPFTKGTRALAFVNTNNSICWAREGPSLKIKFFKFCPFCLFLILHVSESSYYYFFHFDRAHGLVLRPCVRGVGSFFFKGGFRG